MVQPGACGATDGLGKRVACMAILAGRRGTSHCRRAHARSCPAVVTWLTICNSHRRHRGEANEEITVSTHDSAYPCVPYVSTRRAFSDRSVLTSATIFRRPRTLGRTPEPCVSFRLGSSTATPERTDGAGTLSHELSCGSILHRERHFVDSLATNLSEQPKPSVIAVERRCRR